jgi:hypothetical protein
VLLLGVEERLDHGEVAAGVQVDQRPRDALAGHAESVLGKQPVILVGVLVVLGFVRQVPPPLSLPLEGRALEAGDKERREDAFVFLLGHLLLRLQSGLGGSTWTLHTGPGRRGAIDEQAQKNSGLHGIAMKDRSLARWYYRS